MSISTELTRIQTARNTLRNKAVELGIAQSTAKLDALATAYDGIENRGAVSANVQEGDTYTIPKGYHNGSGTVSGVSGGGSYTLQSKTATPTKSQQNVTPDAGYYGLSDVTVAAIPEAYQDVSSVTATADYVLSGKVFVAADGTVTAGTMANNGDVVKVLTTSPGQELYKIPKGYHYGGGTVSITTEAKTATPTKQTQTITPSTGKVLSLVTVDPIPEEYVDTSDATATAADLLFEKTAYAGGVKITGTMANNGEIAATIDGLTTAIYTVPAGYTSGGMVSLTGDIEAALAAI